MNEMEFYDTVQPVNISDEFFQSKHNGMEFRTRNLERKQSKYSIFNGRLYHIYSGTQEKYNEKGLALNYTGLIDIYASIPGRGAGSWVEYTLAFLSGNLVDVHSKSEHISNDWREAPKPAQQEARNQVKVTLCVDGLDAEHKDAFIGAIEGRLGAIRDAMGEPGAVIFYPTKLDPSKAGDTFAPLPQILHVVSMGRSHDDVKQASAMTADDCRA